MFFSRLNGPISTKFGTKHSWVKVFKFAQMKDCVIFRREIITKRRKKKTFMNLKKETFYLRTIGSNLCTMHPWVKGIKICSMKGSALFQWVIIAKYIDWFLQSSTTEPLGQYQTRAKIIFGWREFKFVQMKDPSYFWGKIMTKQWKYIDDFRKSTSPEPLGQFQSHMAQIILGLREY